MGRCYTKADEIDIVYTTAWCSCSEKILTQVGYDKNKDLFAFKFDGTGKYKILKSIVGKQILKAGYRGVIIDGDFYIFDSDYNNVVDYLTGKNLDYGGMHGDYPCGGYSSGGYFYYYDFTTSKFEKGSINSNYRIADVFLLDSNIYSMIEDEDYFGNRGVVNYSGIGYMGVNGYDDSELGYYGKLIRFDFASGNYYGGYYFQLDDADNDIKAFFKGTSSDWALIERRDGEIVLVEIDWTESSLSSNDITLTRQTISSTASITDTGWEESLTVLLESGGGSIDNPIYQKECPS